MKSQTFATNLLSKSFSLTKPNRWIVLTVVIALIMSLPVLVVGSAIFQPLNENWQHLKEFLLAEYILNSLTLMLGVSFGVLTMGVITAWLTSMCEFPNRRVFSWVLLLPLAIQLILLLTLTLVFWILQDPYKHS